VHTIIKRVKSYEVVRPLATRSTTENTYLRYQKGVVLSYKLQQELWRHERPTTNYKYLVQHDVNGCIAFVQISYKEGWMTVGWATVKNIIARGSLGYIHATILGPTENGLPTIDI